MALVVVCSVKVHTTSLQVFVFEVFIYTIILTPVCRNNNKRVDSRVLRDKIAKGCLACDRTGKDYIATS